MNRGAEDEDGNARVSWLERRGGDMDYNLHSHPLRGLVERHEVSLGVGVGSRWVWWGGAGRGVFFSFC